MDYMMLLPHEIETLINEYEAENQFHFPSDYRQFLKYHNYARLKYIHFYIQSIVIRKQKIIKRRHKRTYNNIYFFTMDKSPAESFYRYTFWKFDYQNFRYYQLTPTDKRNLKRKYIIFASDIAGNLFGFDKNTKKIIYIDSHNTYVHVETIADNFTEFIGTSFENVLNSHGGYA